MLSATARTLGDSCSDAIVSKGTSSLRDRLLRDKLFEGQAQELFEGQAQELFEGQAQEALEGQALEGQATFSTSAKLRMGTGWDQCFGL